MRSGTTLLRIPAQGRYPAYFFEAKEVGISRPLSAEEAGDISQLVDELIQEWCRLWVQVGGFAQFQHRKSGAM